MKTKKKIVCVISLRNLGDIVIQSRFISVLAKSVEDTEWIIWTRNEGVFYFEGIPNSTIFTSTFLFKKDISLSKIYLLLKTILRLRKYHFSFVIDFIGDFRERLLVKLLRTEKHLFPFWGAQHVFLNTIRNPFGVPIGGAYIDPVNINIYKSYQIFIDYIVNAMGGKKKLDISYNYKKLNKQVRIGLHPFASQQCKLWSYSNWLELAQYLLENEYEIVVFGAESENVLLNEIFCPIKDKIIICTKKINLLDSYLMNIDLMICLDSFSVHLASLKGIRSIMINGSNNKDLFAPPNSLVLANSGNCVNYPCYNKPKCLGALHEFACINSISVSDVVKEAERISKKSEH